MQTYQEVSCLTLLGEQIGYLLRIWKPVVSNIIPCVSGQHVTFVYSHRNAVSYSYDTFTWWHRDNSSVTRNKRTNLKSTALLGTPALPEAGDLAAWERLWPTSTCSYTAQHRVGSPQSTSALSQEELQQREVASSELLDTCTSDEEAALQTLLLLLVEREIALVVGLDDPLVQMGLTSVTAMRLITLVQQQLDSGIRLEIFAVFMYPTVRQLAGHIAELVDLDAAVGQHAILTDGAKFRVSLLSDEVGSLPPLMNLLHMPAEGASTLIHPCS